MFGLLISKYGSLVLFQFALFANFSQVAFLFSSKAALTLSRSKSTPAFSSRSLFHPSTVPCLNNPIICFHQACTPLPAMPEAASEVSKGNDGSGGGGKASGRRVNVSNVTLDSPSFLLELFSLSHTISVQHEQNIK